MLTVVTRRTLPLLTTNDAVVAPSAMVTVAGTLASFEYELDSAITTPPAGAGAVNVTVPVAVCPLRMVLGLTATPLRAAAPGGLTVTLAVLLASEYEAVSVAGVAALTVPAVTVNVAEVAPGATVTLGGTLAAEGLELKSDTTTPPDGAAAVNVTVPVAD